MILARLAMVREHQGKGLGKALLNDALLCTAQTADIAGIGYLLIHAIDEEARRCHKSGELDSSATYPYQLVLLVKNLKELPAG